MQIMTHKRALEMAVQALQVRIQLREAEIQKAGVPHIDSDVLEWEEAIRYLRKNLATR